MKSRLTRSRSEKMIAGVCGGIAEYFGWDPTLVRIAFVISSFIFSVSFIPLIIYIILMFVMPEA
ncbi:MAG: PspC domain-containing protein [Bacteroidota bacterium]